MQISTGTLVAGLAAIALSGCLGATEPEEVGDSDQSALPRAEQPVACPSEGAALQVLGSGGPLAEASHDPGRAGTSYLLWIDGELRLLIDAGVGSFLRFAEAGEKIATLDAILLTHLHADHAGDLADILNSGGFEGRTAPLPVIGPDSALRFAGTEEFLTRLLSKENGALPIMADIWTAPRTSRSWSHATLQPSRAMLVRPGLISRMTIRSWHTR